MPDQPGGIVHAADSLAALEARAKQAGLLRVIIPAVLVALAATLLGSCWDQHRAAFADGQTQILEHEIAEAQHARHAATVAVLAARHRSDSLQGVAAVLDTRRRATEANAARLAQQVRVLDSTHLVVQVTPGPAAHDTVVGVPPPVVARIVALEQTVAIQDSVIALRDQQLAARDTEHFAAQTVMASDSTVITAQSAEIAALKHARPRFGFKSGFATGVGLLVLILHVVK